MQRQPKRSDWLFVVAALLLVGFWAAVLTGSFPSPKPYTQKQERAEPATPQESAQDISAETIAYYTKVLAWFYWNSCRSVETARRSADVAERALVTTHRALVFPSKVHAVAGLSQKAGMAVVDWTFFIVWENTGTTPTRHLYMHTNWKPFDSALTDDFDFPDLSSPSVRPKIVLGPKTTTWSGGCEIPIAVLIDASEKRKRVYLWGWVEYNDVFDTQPRHRTEFCVEIVVAGDPKVAHAPGDMSTPNIPFQYRGGAKFNGIDDECYRKPTTRPPRPT